MEFPTIPTVPALDLSPEEYDIGDTTEFVEKANSRSTKLTEWAAGISAAIPKINEMGQALNDADISTPDQAYDSQSTSAQSGVAIAEALADIEAGSAIDTISTNVTITGDVTLTARKTYVSGGVQGIGAGQSLTLDQVPDAGRTQIFNLDPAGTLMIRSAGTVFPEWLGDNDTNIKDILKASFVGSKTSLDTVEYVSTGIDILYSGDTEFGGDIGKKIVGNLGSRAIDEDNTSAINEWFGSVIKLANGAERNLINLDSTGSFTHGSGLLSGLMLDGNKNQQAGNFNVLNVKNLKDMMLESLNIRRGYNGINFEGSNNQIGLDKRIEIHDCDNDGIRGAPGDCLNPGAQLIAVSCGRFGHYISGGRLHVGGLYAYFNGTGVRLAGNAALSTPRLQCEDNKGVGADLRGSNIHIGMVSVSDNGTAATDEDGDPVAGSQRIDRAGLLLKGARGVTIDHLVSSNRSGAAKHNQDTLAYDDESTGVVINHIWDESKLIHNITGAKTYFRSTKVEADPSLGATIQNGHSFKSATALTIHDPDVPANSSEYIPLAGSSLSIANVSTGEIPRDFEYTLTVQAGAAGTLVSFGSRYSVSPRKLVADETFQWRFINVMGHWQEMDREPTGFTTLADYTTEDSDFGNTVIIANDDTIDLHSTENNAMLWKTITFFSKGATEVVMASSTATVKGATKFNQDEALTATCVETGADAATVWRLTGGGA